MTKSIPDPMPEGFQIVAEVTKQDHQSRVRLPLYRCAGGLSKGGEDLWSGPVRGDPRPGRYYFDVPAAEVREVAL